MRIIPAIDIIEGKCVRLTKGDYATQKIYNEDPLEVAKAFEDRGVNFLHLVDFLDLTVLYCFPLCHVAQLALKRNLFVPFLLLSFLMMFLPCSIRLHVTVLIMV